MLSQFKGPPPKGAKEKWMEKKHPTESEDLNWHVVLGMMAGLLVSFGLYGAAMATYITLMQPV